MFNLTVKFYVRALFYFYVSFVICYVSFVIYHLNFILCPLFSGIRRSIKIEVIKNVFLIETSIFNQ